MPLIGTTGAASARGFGLFAASTAAPAYVGVTTSPNDNFIYGVATDSQNNTIFVMPNPGSGAPIMKVSPSGVIVWAKLYGSTGNGYFKSVICDASDNIYAVGKTPGVSNDEFGSIVKFDSSGNILWQIRQNPGNTGFYQREMIWESVKLMPNGNIVVGGTYTDFNRVFVCCCGFVKVAVNYFAVAVYNSSGTLQWRAKYGSTSPTSQPNVQWTGLSVGVDSSNSIYITGQGPDVTGAGNKAIPIIKYNSAGAFQWGYTYQNSTSTISNGGTLAVGPSGIYATSFGNVNSYLLKVDSSGTFQWGRRIQGGSGVSWESLQASTVDATDNFYATGNMRYGGVTQVYDYATVKVDSSGNTQWLRSLGRVTSSSQDEISRAITISADNHYCIGGNTFGGITQELFGRLKTDGSQTGTYVVGSSTVVQYAAIPLATLIADTATVRLSSASSIVTSGSSSLTYTDTAPTNTISNFGATIQTTTL
jgi:hypothetical protein